MSTKTTSPTLETIKMIEKAIVESDDEIKSLAHLKRLLPKQVNHYALKATIEYLEECNRIYIGSKGMTWLNDHKMKGIKH